MKKKIWFVFLVIALLVAAIPVSADEELFWSNFNSDPVKNGPKYYSTFPIKEDQAPVLVTRIRTFHWNSGEGAAPGKICVYENGEELQCWQAVGRSAYGSQNVYWETLTDFTMLPGHTYGFKDSDFTTWSYNDASRERGMIEIYAESAASASTAPSASAKSPAAAPSASAGYTAPANPTVGQTFLFGRFEQDNNVSNGAEPIEWQVLTVQNDRALVVSRKALEYRPFVDGAYSATWDSSSIRNWLNSDFYNSAFTGTEKNSILLVTNNNPANIIYGTYGGSNTQDHIFLLNIDEANRYFRGDTDRICSPTAHVQTKMYVADGRDGSSVTWALRSPGYSENTTAMIAEDGVVDYRGLPNYSNGINTAFAIRPAFWLKITAKTCFKVTYKGSYCLSKVPTDNKCYQPGDMVKVLFEPVEYMPGLIFSGWDRNGDGAADHGYYFDSFVMPAKDVELTAICYQQYYDQQQYHQDNAVTRPADPGNGPYDIINDNNFVPGNNNGYFGVDFDYEYGGVG